jgi:tripartite-type tricarboxylate transporter receptor subunit TctC
VQGRASHSSSPWLGVDAIQGAHQVITRLAALDLGLEAHALLGRATLTPTAIRSYPEATHTIQNLVRMTYDRRLLPGQDPAAALRGIERTLAGMQPWTVSVRAGALQYPAELPAESLFLRCAQAGNRRMGLVAPDTFVSHGCVDTGLSRVAQAKPDGYTVVLASIGQATSATLYRKLRYDPVESFDAVGLIAEVPMTIVSRKDFPAENVGALLAHIQAHKTNVSYANAGVGSASHLCGLLFMSALKTEMNVFSYRGTAPAMNDLLGGRIDVLCDHTTNTSGPIRAGSIKAYAVTTKERVASVSQLPTLHESGLRDFELSIWNGLLVPKGSPKPAIEQLSAALGAAIAGPAFTKRLDDLGAQPVSAERASPAHFGKYFRDEATRWAPIIKAAGQYAD